MTSTWPHQNAKGVTEWWAADCPECGHPHNFHGRDSFGEQIWVCSVAGCKCSGDTMGHRPPDWRCNLVGCVKCGGPAPLLSTRHFVILLGRETVEETLGLVEEKHGPVVDHHSEEHGRLVRRAKLHPSNCGRLFFGVVEIQPHDLAPRPRPQSRPPTESELAAIPDLWPPDLFELPHERENKAALRCGRVALAWADWEAAWNAAAKHRRKCSDCKRAVEGEAFEYSCVQAPPFPETVDFSALAESEKNP